MDAQSVTPGRGSAQGSRVPVACAGCGSVVMKWRSDVRRTSRQHCSAECYRASRVGELNPKWRGGLLARLCQRCSAPMEVAPAHAKRGEGLFCSAACRVEGKRIWPDEVTRHRVRARRMDYRKRAKRSDLTHHTEQEWADLLSQHGGRCAHCGSADNIERDHIVPLSKGGDDDIGNIQPLCRACNRRKWDKGA